MIYTPSPTDMRKGLRISTAPQCNAQWHSKSKMHGFPWRDVDSLYGKEGSLTRATKAWFSHDTMQVPFMTPLHDDEGLSTGLT